MTDWEAGMLRFMNTSNPDLVKEISTGNKISDELSKKLDAAFDAFNSTWA